MRKVFATEACNMHFFFKSILNCCHIVITQECSLPSFPLLTPNSTKLDPNEVYSKAANETNAINESMHFDAA